MLKKKANIDKQFLKANFSFKKSQYLKSNAFKSESDNLEEDFQRIVLEIEILQSEKLYNGDEIIKIKFYNLKRVIDADLKCAIKTQEIIVLYGYDKNTEN